MRANRGLICAMAIGVLAAGAACPASGETNALGQRPHASKNPGGRFMAEFAQLNLTADQRQKIESIVQLNQESMKAAAIPLRETREALNCQMQAGPFDEQSVRAACKKTAAAEEEVAVLRAKVAGQIRAVLTSDQQAALDKIRTNVRSNMPKQFGKGRGAINQ